MTSFAVQNCERVGLINGKAPSARDAMNIGRERSGRKSKQDVFEKTMEKLPAMMEKCFIGMFSGKHLEDRLILLEDQLQKQQAMHVVL